MSSQSILLSFYTYLAEEKHASSHTVSAYKSDLSAYEKYCAERDVALTNATSDFIDGFKIHLMSKGFSPSSVSRYMSSVRGFYKYLFQSELVGENPTRRIKTEKIARKNPDILSADEVDYLLSQPENTSVKGLRDRAMLETMYATGMKVTELLELNVTDVNVNLGFIRCHGTSEHKSDRTVYLYPAALKAIKAYFESSRPLLTADSEALFVNVAGRRMTRQGFWKILKSYAAAAGIEKNITPHTLRHSFAAHLLANGAEIADVQEILGHKDIASTQVYMTYLKSKMNKSYLKFHPHY